jgi:hypothetical protein
LVARTEVAWAQLDRKVGSNDAAEAKLADALDLAQRYGFGALMEQIEAPG